MNLLAAASSADLDGTIANVLPMIVFWLIGAILVLGFTSIVAKCLKNWKLEVEFAELQDWNMALHDSWRSSAGRGEFERHRRSCRRCRGDLLGQRDFVLPEELQRHTLQDLRDSKENRKSRRAELGAQS